MNFIIKNALIFIFFIIFALPNHPKSGKTQIISQNNIDLLYSIGHKISGTDSIWKFTISCPYLGGLATFAAVPCLFYYFLNFVSMPNQTSSQVAYIAPNCLQLRQADLQAALSKLTSRASLNLLISNLLSSQETLHLSLEQSNDISEIRSISDQINSVRTVIEFLNDLQME